MITTTRHSRAGQVTYIFTEMYHVSCTVTGSASGNTTGHPSLEARKPRSDPAKRLKQQAAGQNEVTSNDVTMNVGSVSAAQYLLDDHL